MVQIVWLKDARTDLKEIYEYIAIDSKRYARLQVERIKDSTKILYTKPQIGKLVQEINQPEIREIIEGNYRIIYKHTSSDKIHILMVHHGARDLQRRIK
ncbi:MAG: type II toxin-antitoxin system RelE/ParE family toxin [Polaribacter sp.]|uniref:type II toxin-antitoxin system RelE/ParE family toxin n=1 Tax=Polaribacter sp. TaxID=1920175 RepID=UPI003BAEC28E